MRFAVALTFLGLAGLPVAEQPPVISVTARLGSDPVLNRPYLEQIRDKILKGGVRRTYCERFSDNPAMRLGNRWLFLDPSPGSSASAYTTLVIQSLDGAEPYVSVEFRADPVELSVAWPTPGFDLFAALERAREAVSEALKAP
jgi:hypothetical protein